jgi:hypothetical protein
MATMTLREFLEGLNNAIKENPESLDLEVSSLFNINESIVKHPLNMDSTENKKVTYCYQCGTTVRNQVFCHGCGRKLIWNKV